MKITIVGTGYVGLSNALLLAKHNNVIALDLIPSKVEMLNKAISPIEDKEIQEHLLDHKNNSTLNISRSHHQHGFTATLDKEKAYKNANFIIIATPTDYDPEIDFFDTSSIESVIKDIIKIKSDACIVIKSTVPIGYTQSIKNKYKNLSILFSPEFLREGSALYDNLYPSRIIIGGCPQKAKEFSELLVEGALKKDVQVAIMEYTEAEAVKLFSNTYLAMRIAYFNELDTYAEKYSLSSKSIIEGVSLDPRIGAYYNNPSFGFGGYCLPKDTQQLKANFKTTPNALINAIVESNKIRKEHIADSVVNKNLKVIGIYRLTMKTDSDNLRYSAVQEIISLIKSKSKDIEVLIYEPILTNSLETDFLGCKVISNLDVFKEKSELIISNRLTNELQDVLNITYTRDLFHNN